ncbi:hypothetical protein Y032_0558g3423 [Ancylostoma ceylanicum]|uniref:Uncharacterized protein n=1 Tax=Ancylostoma ceylanicum TaxID=53326 RepID=A0A016WR35_9BILA|nr:hypothetical protein Y032_0558g3423 [Ancylostoma ceylanicum]
MIVLIPFEAVKYGNALMRMSSVTIVNTTMLQLKSLLKNQTQLLTKWKGCRTKPDWKMVGERVEAKTRDGSMVEVYYHEMAWKVVVEELSCERVVIAAEHQSDICRCNALFFREAINYINASVPSQHPL